MKNYGSSTDPNLWYSGLRLLSVNVCQKDDLIGKLYFALELKAIVDNTKELVRGKNPHFESYYLDDGLLLCTGAR